MAPCRNISPIWITACWKRSQEEPQPCGLVISGTVLCVPRGPDSGSCLCSEKGKALSLLRSLLSAAGRAVTGDATVSASLCFMALVKAVQGAGSRVRVRREWAEEGVRVQALMEDTSRPWAAVWLTSAGVRKQGDDGAAGSYDCCLMCVLARCIWMLSERATTHWAFDHFAGGCWRKRDVLRAFTHPERERAEGVLTQVDAGKYVKRHSCFKTQWGIHRDSSEVSTISKFKKHPWSSSRGQNHLSGVDGMFPQQRADIL